MDRRQFVSLTGLTAAASYVADTLVLGGTAAAGSDSELLAGFLALPGKKGVQIDIDAPGNFRRVQHAADAPLFCGSCFKTFVLATYLQQVEADRLSLSEQLAIDNAIRSTGGNVFDHLTGTAPARTVLEAMIAHSDNTATDVAMRRVGADKVRAFIDRAGLKGARIPDSTRRYFSYVAGYDPGVDMGWQGVEALLADKIDKKPRDAINAETTMACPAATFVDYYKRALKGEFFRKPATLVEFKRIQAMADAIAVVVPPDTPAYMKGGSIDWIGFHCMTIAGQMIVRGTPVTLCLNLNWRDSDNADTGAVIDAYKTASTDVLARVHASVLQGRT
jgi:beta-lactamase class A